MKDSASRNNPEFELKLETSRNNYQKQYKDDRTSLHKSDFYECRSQSEKMTDIVNTMTKRETILCDIYVYINCKINQQTTIQSLEFEISRLIRRINWKLKLNVNKSCLTSMSINIILWFLTPPPHHTHTHPKKKRKTKQEAFRERRHLYVCDRWP